MPESIREVQQALRLTVISDSLIWGNANFQTKVGLAVSSGGEAYTVQNLRYAASLLEARAERREAGLRDGEEVPRGNRILERILSSVKAGPPRKRKQRSATIPRVHGRRSDVLSDWRVKQDVMFVLVFLELHKTRLGLSRAASTHVTRVLAMIIPTRERPAGLKTPRARRPAPKSAADQTPGSLESLRRKLPAGFHWAQSLTALPDFADTEWPLPVKKLCPVLDTCDQTKCWAAPRGSTERTVAVKFFRGDWKPLPAPRPLPVIFISGWQAQLDATSLPLIKKRQRKSGYGFTSEDSFSTAPPPVPYPGAGTHPVPPPPIVSAGFSLPHEFRGLVNHLRRAGYPHARFRLSQPADHIQIAVNDLYGVVDLAKKVFQVDKVILVGHSRGGLIIRKYILDRWNAEGTIDVEKVITYGTPHLGAQLANVGEEVIVNGVLSAVAGPTISASVDTVLDAVDLIPGAGPEITNEIESAIIGEVADLVAPVLDGMRAFLESGEELKTNSPFVAALNDAYSKPVVQRAERKLSLWEAIDHVLVAGTSPSFFKVYVGSWWPLTPPEIALLQMGDICFHTLKIWGAVIEIPYPCWHWQWRWYTVLDLLPDVASNVDEAMSIAAGGPTIVKAFHEDLGDGVVETSSALAEGVIGNIRRTQFKLQHFNVKTNDEVSAPHEGPDNAEVVVKPWQLLFVELGVPFDETTRCDAEDVAWPHEKQPIF